MEGGKEHYKRGRPIRVGKGGAANALEEHSYHTGHPFLLYLFCQDVNLQSTSQQLQSEALAKVTA